MATIRHQEASCKNAAIRMRSGFTLLELMVVTLIISILAMLAAGPFMKARERAMLTASRAELRNALRFVEMHVALYNTLPKAVTDLDKLDYREGPQVVYCQWQYMGGATGPIVNIVLKHRALKKRAVTTIHPLWSGRIDEKDVNSCTDVRSTPGGKKK